MAGLASSSPFMRRDPGNRLSRLMSEQGITLPPLPFAKTQEVASQPDNERSRNERELKRRCLGPATGQYLAVDPWARDTRDLKINGTQDDHDNLQNPLNLGQIDMLLGRLDDLKKREEDVNDSIQTWKASMGPPTDSSITRDFRMPGSEPPENNHDLGLSGYSRGRTLQRTAHTIYSPQTRPVSRAGSASSARSMIDERLEWAHQDRVRSASRDRSVSPSPFHEHSPFYAEFSKNTGPEPPWNVNESRDITPIDPPHGAEAQRYTCSRINPITGKPCNITFPRLTFSPQDLTRHDDFFHYDREKSFVRPNCHEKEFFPRIQALTQHMCDVNPEGTNWSCAALANLEDAICRISIGFTVCAYCGMGLQDSLSDEQLFEHLFDAHHFRKCDTTKKFFHPDHFRKHLQESHGASIGGEWINILCNRCFGSDQIIPGTMDTMSTTKQPIPRGPDAVPTPLPPPTCIPEISTAPKSAGRSVSDCQIVGHGSSAAFSPDPNTDQGLESQHLIGVVSNESVTRKRRMSSPVPHSVIDDWWPSSATPKCTQAAAVESSTTERCTKAPDSPGRPIAAVEERKPESRHICSTCQRSFARRSTLANHERTHTGEKPFSCTFEGCSQTFAQKGDKTRHEQTQHTENTFRCGSSDSEGLSWGCGREFPRKDGLLEHHRKTKKGKQCLADRDKLVGLERGDEDSLAFP